MSVTALCRRLGPVPCVLLLLGAGVGPGGAQQIEDGRLTMEIEDEEPLADVLRSIARAAGAELSLEGDLGPAAPQTFDAVPLDIAVRRLVGTHSVVMIHTPGTTGRLAEIRVYAAEGDPQDRRQASVQQAREAARAARAEAAAGSGDRRERAARVQEVRDLARSGDPAAVDQLVQILAAEPDPAIRRLAIGALGGLGDPAADEAIAGALQDEDRAVRVQALRALSNLLGADVAPYLARIVTSDEEPAVRMMAVQMAADLEGGPALDVLEQALNDPDPEVRALAAGELGR